MRRFARARWSRDAIVPVGTPNAAAAWSFVRSVKGSQEKRLSLVGAEREEGGGEGRPAPGRIGAGGRLAVVEIDGHVAGGAGVGAAASFLGAAVSTDEIVRDAVEPWEGALGLRSERRPSCERAYERLRREVVGEVTPEPPVQIPMDGHEVAVKETDKGVAVRDRPGRRERRRSPPERWTRWQQWHPYSFYVRSGLDPSSSAPPSGSQAGAVSAWRSLEHCP